MRTLGALQRSEGRETRIGIARSRFKALLAAVRLCRANDDKVDAVRQPAPCHRTAAHFDINCLDTEASRGRIDRGNEGGFLAGRTNRTLRDEEAHFRGRRKTKTTSTTTNKKHCVNRGGIGVVQHIVVLQSSQGRHRLLRGSRLGELTPLEVEPGRPRGRQRRTTSCERPVRQHKSGSRDGARSATNNYSSIATG